MLFLSFLNFLSLYMRICNAYKEPKLSMVYIVLPCYMIEMHGGQHQLKYERCAHKKETTHLYYLVQREHYNIYRLYSTHKNFI